jgi:CRP-like cAMP-binding protein
MQELFKHIHKYTSITQEEFIDVMSFFEIQKVNKKEIIYFGGHANLEHYFVLEGCLHMYLVNATGAEQTLQFAIQNWWLTDYLAFQNNRSSEFYIQAVEATTMLKISYDNQEILLKKHPKMDSYFRNIYQIAYGAAIMRMKYLFTYSKEDIYLKFQEAFPEFVNCVPQYLVATYLGISPEYVSKIRKKRLS